MQIPSLGWEDPLEEEMATTPVLLLGKSHAQRGFRPWGCKGSDTTEQTRTTKYLKQAM